MVVINPCNPTSQILSYENMVEIVKFCDKTRLILLADKYLGRIYEIFGFKKEVKAQIFKLTTTQISSSSCGQVVIEIVLKVKQIFCTVNLILFQELIATKFKAHYTPFHDYIYQTLSSSMLKIWECNQIYNIAFNFCRKKSVFVVQGSGFKQLTNAYHFKYLLIQ
ncbi:hypothetical protein MXB_2380 [Myxobolus squamalis]|nr:hypothetical protein MXB_2380 [Myxobolus squamalis]